MLDSSVIPGMGPINLTIFVSPQTSPSPPLPTAEQESPQTFPTPQLPSLARDERAHTSPLAPGGVVLPTSPFHLTVPNHSSVAPLPTVDSELVGTDPPVSNSLAFGHTTLGNLLNNLAPSSVETLHPVPIPTFRGRSPIIRESSDLPSSSHCVNSSDSTGKDFSWSRGLGLETSPIKTRSARRKAISSVTLPTFSST
jgi:hypothetical protein